MALDLSKYGVTPTNIAPQTPAQLPDAPLSERVWNDISSAGKNIADTISNTKTYGGAIKSGFQATASAFNAVPAVASELLPKQGREALSKVGDVYSGIIDRLGYGFGSTPAFVDWVSRHPDAAKALEDVAQTGKSAGDISNTILLAEGAKSMVQKTVNAASDTAAQLDKVYSEPAQKPNQDIVKEWQRPINAPKATFNKTRAIIDKNPQTPEFLAQLQVDPRSMIEDGKYMTADTADALRETAGKLASDALQPALKKADYSAPATAPSSLEDTALSAVRRDPNVTAGDLESIKSTISKELDALQRKYPSGLRLSDLNSEKITYAKNGGYKPTSISDNNISTANRAISTALADALDKNAPPELPVKEFRAELGKYYQAADFLDSLNTKVAPASIVQAVARTAARYVGAAGGELLGRGVVSAFAGYQIGKAIETMLENLSGKARGLFINELQTTNPEAFQAVKDYLAKNYNFTALPQASFTPMGPETPPAPPESGIQVLPAEKGLPNVNKETGKFQPTYQSVPKGEGVTPKSTIPPELAPLAKEAQKYSSAEEFVRAIRQEISDRLYSLPKKAGYKSTQIYSDANGKPAGSVAWHDEGSINYKGETGPVISIAKITSDVKGTGAGTKIVSDLKTLADSRNARLVVDWVEPQSEGFWKKMGFDVKMGEKGINQNGYAIYRGSKSQLTDFYNKVTKGKK